MDDADRAAMVEAALNRRLKQGSGTIIPGSATSAAPLSHVQESLWILSQLAGKAATNNRPVKLRLSGLLQVEGLVWALERIVERHAVLRSTFPLRDESPVQVVHDPPRVRLETVQVVPTEGEEPLGAAGRLARSHTSQRIDLMTEIPFRPALFRLAPDDHVLAVASHHIVFDGWSEQIFISELATLYDTWCEGGRTNPLPPLPMQFADFAEWERGRISTERLGQQLEFWKRSLSDLPPDFELPSDRVVTGKLSSPVNLELGPELRDRVERLAREHGVTLFMALLSVLAALISRHSGQDDFVIGVPTAGRRLVESEPLIGCFINTVLLRLATDGNPSFGELVSQARTVSLQAFDNQDVPYSQVLGAIRPWASGDHTPLYRVHFQLRNFPELPVPSRHLRIEEFDPVGAAGAYLSVRAVPQGDSLMLQFAADPRRFDRSTIERWTGHFRRLLESISERPDLGVRDHVLLGDAEALRLQNFNQPTPEDHSSPPLVTEAFRIRASLAPDDRALIDGDLTLSFIELDRLIDRVAANLIARGVQRGDRVVLFMERGAAAIASMFGVMRAGAAFVPVDAEATSAWLNPLVDDTAPVLIITQKSVRDQIGGSRIPVVTFEDLSQWSEQAFDPVVLARNDLAYVLFTSGSTGRPKGVLVEHRNLATFIANSSAHRRIGPGEREILLHAISFDGSFDSIFVPLLLGATVVVRDPQTMASIPRFLAWCDTHQITHMDIPTGFFNVLAAEVLERNLDLPERVRLVSIGGEQGRADLVVRWQRRFGGRIRLANDYGPTEATVWVTTKEVEPDTETTWLPIGRPSPGCPVYVLDPAGRLAPIGILGEICIGGDQVAAGYLNRPDLTTDRFVPDPFGDRPAARMYRSGDLGRWLPNGDLEVVGRLDRQVKVRGYRVEPGEVEDALRHLPGVADCAVVARSETSGDTGLVAYMKMSQSHLFNYNEILRALALSLPPFMLPTHLVEVSSLPRNVAGKLDATRLPEPSPSAHPEGVRRRQAPSTPLEESIAEIWSEVLQREVDVNTGFFELGGHSLLAIRVMSRIQARLGVELPLSVLFTHPTVELVAAAVTEKLAADVGPGLGELLDELDAISDEEAVALLAQMDVGESGYR